MKTRPALLVVLLSFPLVARAADTQPVVPRAGETIEVSIVDFDVVVTDKQGHRVHGLTKDDFEVFEDKKPQAITNFAEYTAETPEREKRTIALFIDRFFDAKFRVEPTYKALKETLHELIAPGDSVLIATWNGYPTIALEATDNLAAVDQTLDEIARENTSNPFQPMFRVGPLLDSSVVQVDRGIRFRIQGEEWYLEAERRHELRNEVAVINSLINAMADQDGRKALILMSRNVGPANGSTYYYTVDRHLSKWHDYYRSSAFDTVKATAAARNVVVYAFPPGSPLIGASLPSRFRGGPDPAVEAAIDQIAAMRDIAKSTGGAYAVGTDILKALPRLRDDIVDYYSLAYRVPSRNDNRVRNVVVKTKNPDYKVRTRREYFEKTDDARMRDAVIASFLQPAAPSGMAVAANVGQPVKQARNRFSIPVSVQLPATGTFSLYVATGASTGEMSNISKETVSVTGSPVEYHFNLITDASASRLSIGVYDEASHDSGFARVDLPGEQR